MKCLIIQGLIIFSFFANGAHAVGERLLDAVMRSDFVFDNDVSNVPFFPLGYLGGSFQDSTNIIDCEQEICEFSKDGYYQGLGLPVWIGQKNMFILGESLEHEYLEASDGQSISLKTAGGLAAWVSQPTDSIQAGAFYYYYSGFDSKVGQNEPWGEIYGGAVRYRHRPDFHSYWGLVGMKDQSSNGYYPYAGFDWYIGEKWSVSAVLPWPSVSYAPNRDFIVRFGALYSGSTWIVEGDGAAQLKSISQINAGFSMEKRISGMIWGEIGAGYSGFGRYVIREENDADFVHKISKSPFLKFTINIRPE